MLTYNFVEYSELLLLTTTEGKDTIYTKGHQVHVHTTLGIHRDLCKIFITTYTSSLLNIKY